MKRQPFIATGEVWQDRDGAWLLPNQPEKGAGTFCHSYATLGALLDTWSIEITGQARRAGFPVALTWQIVKLTCSYELARSIVLRVRAGYGETEAVFAKRIGVNEAEVCAFEGGSATPETRVSVAWLTHEKCTDMEAVDHDALRAFAMATDAAVAAKR